MKYAENNARIQDQAQETTPDELGNDNHFFDTEQNGAPPSYVLHTSENIDYGELWKIIRAVLVVWAVGVWLLLVMLPGIQQISDITSAMLHLPYIMIGLGLIGAIYAAYTLKSDGHLLWFLGVLLLLAGWM